MVSVLQTNTINDFLSKVKKLVHFFDSVIKDWNKLSDVKSCKTLVTFKQTQKCNLMQTAINRRGDMYF